MAFNIAANQIQATPFTSYAQGRALKMAQDKADQDSQLLATQIDIAKHGDQRAQDENQRAQESHDTQQKAADIQLKAEDARQLYDETGKVLEQGDNAKAYVEQNFPDEVAKFEPMLQQHGMSWKDATNDQVLALAQGMRDHAAVTAHVSKDKPISVSKGEVLLDPTTNKPIFDNRDDSLTPYQKATLGIEYQKLKLETDKANAANNPLGAGSPTGVANLPNGEDFLKSLPPNIGAQVKALSEGRLAFPSGFALKSPYWQQMLSAVSQYDPSFDQADFNARSKTRADFTSGKSSTVINNLNTAIGHAGTLLSQISGTAGHSGFPFATTANAVQNYLSTKSGNPGVPLFKDTSGKLAEETTAVYRGGSGAEKDVVRALESMDENQSTETKMAIIKNTVDLFQSKLDAIGDKYNKGMGTTKDPLELLNPHAQKTFKALSEILSNSNSASDVPDDIAALLKKHGGK